MSCSPPRPALDDAERSAPVDPPRPEWRWPWPQTCGQVYAVILTMLLGFMAAAFLLDGLKQVLGRWQ